MTGPEHYRAAEQCLAYAADEDLGSDAERYNLAAAQVHATLAHAAAVALEVTATMPPHVTSAGADWREVISPAEQTVEVSA